MFFKSLIKFNEEVKVMRFPSKDRRNVEARRIRKSRSRDQNMVLLEDSMGIIDLPADYP